MDQGKRQNKGEEDIKNQDGKIGEATYSFKKNPEFLKERVTYFDELLAEQ